MRILRGVFSGQSRWIIIILIYIYIYYVCIYIYYVYIYIVLYINMLQFQLISIHCRWLHNATELRERPKTQHLPAFGLPGPSKKHKQARMVTGNITWVWATPDFSKGVATSNIGVKHHPTQGDLNGLQEGFRTICFHNHKGLTPVKFRDLHESWSFMPPELAGSGRSPKQIGDLLFQGLVNVPFSWLVSNHLQTSRV